MDNHQSGNVLFYIMIAVALLAALSYAVSQNFRGGAGNINSERAELNASEIIEYGSILSQSVSQIRLRGYKNTEISFENNVVAGYANANCTYVECEIFHVSGGGVDYMTPKSVWLDSANSASLRYGEIYFHGNSSAVEVGLSEDDLIMFVPYIKKSLCIEINRRLGIIPTTLEVPLELNGPFDDNVKFTGSFGGAFDRKVSGDDTTGETTILYGLSAGCTEGSGIVPNPAVGTYHYYQVLISR